MNPHGYKPIPLSDLFFIKTLFISLFYLISTLCSGQNIRPKFDNFTIDDGLIQGTIYSIAQDKKGFMWFGTASGLNRFDGYEFKSFPKNNDKQADSIQTIRGLYVSRDGKLWVGGGRGMFGQFDYETESFIKFPLKLPDSTTSNNFIYSITEDADGHLWIATLGDGVYQYDPISNKFTIYRHNDLNKWSLSSNRVNVLFVDSKNRLWVGTDDSGLSRFDKESGLFVHFQHDDHKPTSLSHNAVNSIYEDSKHRLWIGTISGGLNLWNESKESFIHYRTNNTESARVNSADSIASNNIMTIIEEQPGILWLGTQFEGLNRFHIESGQFQHIRNSITDKQSLVHDYIISSFKDDEGSIWFGTYTNGVSRFDPTRSHFNHYAHDQLNPDGLGPPTIFNFAARDNNTLWISGTGFDLFDRTNNTFTHYKHNSKNKNSLVADYISMLYLDNNKHLWIATDRNGLNDFDIKKNTFTHYHQDGDNRHRISSNELSSLTPYDEDNLWLGARNGSVDLLNIKTGNIRNARYVQRNDSHNINEKYLLSRRVNTVLTDSKERTWVATAKGLFKLHMETMMFKEVSHPLLNTIVAYSLLEDVKGDLWIGTGRNGLLNIQHKSGNVISYSQQQGLCDSTVYSLLEDNQGNIWVATNNCLAMLSIQSRSFTIYDKGDGLQDNEFNQNAAIKLPSGELVFGGINGFNIFHPEKIRPDTELPRISLTDFFVFNQPVKISTSVKERQLKADKLEYLLEKSVTYTDQVILDYPFKMFGFSFAAQNYKNPSTIQYQYRLSPWDSGWIPTSAKERVAQYSNLPSGEYVFSVKAGNKNGYWNEQDTSVKIIILPPPWKSWWAIMAYTLCIIGLIMIAIRQVKAKQRELHREREYSKRLSRLDKLKDEFLANTSHELRTPLNGIIGLTEALLDRPTGEICQDAKNNMGIVVASGKRLSCLVNDILDFSKLKNAELQLDIKDVDLYSVVNAVLSVSSSLIGNKPIALVNQIDINFPYVSADEDRLQQILYNLIGNAIKFTHTGEVIISAECKMLNILVSVTDTGIGIERNKLETIFQSFEQASGDTARLYGGTGLGLTVTRQLVELHGGTISVTSTLAKGSEFTFTLEMSENIKPICHVMAKTIHHGDAELFVNNEERAIIPTDNSIQKLEHSVESNCQHKILIVDDESINRLVIIGYLENEEYELVEARSGMEALALLEKTRFDLILLDIMMPIMTGYDVCEIIRKTYTGNELPIIFLTAKSQIEDIVNSLSLGGNDYIIKPINKKELVVRVKTHLQLTGSYKHGLEKNIALDTLINKLHELHTPITLIKEPTKLAIKELESRFEKGSIQTIIKSLKIARKYTDSVYDIFSDSLKDARILSLKDDKIKSQSKSISSDNKQSDEANK